MTSNVTPFRNVKHVSLLWAAPERAGEVAELHGRLFPTAWNEGAMRALLEHPASTSLMAVTGQGAKKNVVGFVIGQLAADEAEILSIGVAPEWQHAGLGKMLVEGLIRAARRGEAKRIFLEVAEDNARALSLYRGLGFAETGRRAKYYERRDQPAADALTFQLQL